MLCRLSISIDFFFLKTEGERGRKEEGKNRLSENSINIIKHAGIIRKQLLFPSFLKIGGRGAARKLKSLYSVIGRDYKRIRGLSMNQHSIVIMSQCNDLITLKAWCETEILHTSWVSRLKPARPQKGIAQE